MSADNSEPCNETWTLTVDHSQQNSGFYDDYHPYFLPGCTTTGLSFNSRTFSKMLQTCPYLCGRHRVILEAEERYKKKLQKSCGSNRRHAAYESNLFFTNCPNSFKLRFEFQTCLA